MTTKVRVNLANPMELLELPGISREQAEAILRFRSEHGPITDGTQLAGVLHGPVTNAMLNCVDFDPSDDTAPEAPGA